MAQATLDDDDLFGEAVDELREDVDEHLTAAERSLPNPEAIWAVESDNVLGVLNTLRTNLEAEEAEEHLRQAKKWYALGQRADAFEEEAELADRLSELEEILDAIESVRTAVGDAAGSLPGLREQLADRAEAAAPAAD